MLAPDGSLVPCHVYWVALDALVGGRGELLLEQQAPVFTAMRPKIESVVSDKYDCRPLSEGTMFVSCQDLRDAGILK